jgi:predicted AAA+ superfamily ATPase
VTWLEVGGFPEAQRLDGASRQQLLRDYVDVAILRDVVERHGVSNIAGLRWLVRHLLANAASPFSVEKFGHALETAVLIELERRRCEVTYVRTSDGHEVDFLARAPDGTEHLIQVCADATDADTAAREIRALRDAGQRRPRARRWLLTLTKDRTPPQSPADVTCWPAYQWMLAGGGAAGPRKESCRGMGQAWPETQENSLSPGHALRPVGGRVDHALDPRAPQDADDMFCGHEAHLLDRFLRV